MTPPGRGAKSNAGTSAAGRAARPSARVATPGDDTSTSITTLAPTGTTQGGKGPNKPVKAGKGGAKPNKGSKGKPVAGTTGKARTPAGTNRSSPPTGGTGGRHPGAPGSSVARPERFPIFYVSPLSPVPVLGGPGPAPVPLGGSPLQSIGLNPFRLPYWLPRNWANDTVQQTAKLKVPLALLAAMAMFVLVQGLIDRRDPKVSQAPERHGDDSVGFE